MNELFKIETEDVKLSWYPPSVSKKSLAGATDSDGYLKVVGFSRTRDLSVKKSALPDLAARDLELDAGPRLHEQTDYRVLIQSKLGKRVHVRHSDPYVQSLFSEKDDGNVLFASVNFRSEVGYSTFSVDLDGRPEFNFTVEVYPTKLDYKSDYELLIREIQEYIAGLVLEFIRSTYKLSLPTRRNQTSAVEWLVLLRYVLKDLEQGAAFVARSPIRGLVSEFQSARAERIKRLDSYVRKSVQQGAGSGEFLSVAGAPIRIRIPSRQTAFTLDTPEHRWIATQLRRIREKLISLRLRESEKNETSYFRGENKRHRKLIERLGKLEKRVLRLQQYEPFKAVSELPPAGFASLQLISAPGYAECYRACNILTLGLQLEDGAVNLSLKEISTLYEYWCFLTVVHLVSAKINKPVPAKDFVRTNASGLEITLRAGRESRVTFEQENGRKIEVVYNPRIQDELNISEQRPDMMITLSESNWPTLNLLLDAKYRVCYDDKYVKQFGAPGPHIDAVNALHRYRDSILEYSGLADLAPKRTIIQAAAVFPFRDSSDHTFQNSKLWSSIDKLGIGAIPLIPGDKSYMEIWLDSVLSRGSWSIADRAMGHKASDKVRDWHDAASEAVLVGVLRASNTKEHLEWIESERCYYLPQRRDHPRQFSTKWVALHLPGSGGRAGAVTHAARVLEIDVKLRSQIKTPWAGSRDADQPCLLFKLGPVNRLPRDIVNQDLAGTGQRFSNSRWTSRLAMERATNVVELLLETEAEWRLYEELKAAKLLFKLKAGSVNSLETSPLRWRVWFVITDEIAVRYAGLNGYLVRINEVEEFYSSILDLVDFLLRMAMTK